MRIRRVVAGTDAQGRSTILSDGPAPHSHDFESMPGQAQTRIWFTPQPATTTPPVEEPTTATGPVIPGVGGASFVIVQFAPDAVLQGSPVRSRAGRCRVRRSRPGHCRSVGCQ
jgi:hypothetical protein